MRLTIINQTGSTILYYPSPSKSLPADLQIALLPSSSTTTDLQKHCSTLTLLPREQLKHDDSPEVTESRLKRESAEGFHLRVNSLGTSRAWGLVQLDGYACPWRLYRITVRINGWDFDLHALILLLDFAQAPEALNFASPRPVVLPLGHPGQRVSVLTALAR